MAPSDGNKKFNMGLFVEVLCSALATRNLGPEQGSFTAYVYRETINRQLFITIAPDTFGKGTFGRAIKKIGNFSN